MLDHDDQDQLDEIAARWWAEDARFARGIEQGKPTSPREYRSRTVRILACLGLLALVFGLVTQSMAPILSGLVACVVASTVYSCRSVDNPTGRD